MLRLPIFHILLLPLVWYDFDISSTTRNPDSEMTEDRAKSKRTELNLPIVVIRHISSFCPRPTLFNLLLVSSEWYDATSPILYRDLRISSAISCSIFMGLARTPVEERVHSSHHPSQAAQTTHQDKDNAETDMMDAPFALSWPPVAPIKFLHTPHDIDDTQTPPFPYPYPTRRSHQRKVKLLSYVRHLTVHSLPPWRLSVDLAGCTMLPDTAKIFTSVENLCIGPKAIWSVALFVDALKDSNFRPDRQRHPFFHFLSECCVADHVCLDLPTFKQRSPGVEKYIASHLSLGDQDLTTRELSQKKRKLRRSFKTIASRLDLVIGQLDITRGGPLTKSITVHNFRCGAFSSLEIDGRIRVFLSDCTCSPSMMGYNHPFHRQRCPQHTTKGIRIAQFEDLLSSLQGKENQKKPLGHLAQEWEFVAPSPTTYPSSPIRQQEYWKVIDDEMRMRRSTWSDFKVDLTLSGEAEPCVCCGKK